MRLMSRKLPAPKCVAFLTTPKPRSVCLSGRPFSMQYVAMAEIFEDKPSASRSLARVIEHRT